MRKRTAHPRDDVLCRSDQRGSDERKPKLERKQVAVHGPEHAVQPVPAEPGPPMEISLQQTAAEICDDGERAREDKHATDAKRCECSPLEQRALAHCKRGEPADRDGDGRGDRQRYEPEHRQGRPAGTMLEHPRGGARLRRVSERARKQDDERRSSDTADALADHPTFRVKGAVSTRPSTLHWRNRRHVPPAGRRTPMRSTPGRVCVPVTRVPPRIEVQPLVCAEHTWAWK